MNQDGMDWENIQIRMMSEERQHLRAELARLRALIAKAAALLGPVVSFIDATFPNYLPDETRVDPTQVTLGDIRTLAALLPELRAAQEMTDG